MLKAARWTVVILLVVAGLGLAFSAGYYGRDADGGGGRSAGVDRDATEADSGGDEAPDFDVLNQILDILQGE